MNNCLNFTLTNDEIISMADDFIKYAKEVYDKLCAVKDEERTFSNTIQPLIDIDNRHNEIMSNCEFPAQVSPLKEIRDASSNAEKKLADFCIESNMRTDVYDAVTYYCKNLYDASEFDHETQRYIEFQLRDFKREGLELNDTDRSTVKQKKLRISELCIQFQKNLNEDTSHVYLSEKELKGMPKGFIRSLETKSTTEGSETLYKVTMQYPHAIPCMMNCCESETRSKIGTVYDSRCQDLNGPILEEICTLRHEVANILGYKTHADFVLETKMAKNVDAVTNLYEDLIPKLQKNALSEFKNMQQAKLRREGNDSLQSYDYQFYDELAKKKLGINNEKIRKYFPLEHVTTQILNIYQEILGLTFVRITPEKHQIWHESVSLYEVHDSESGSTIGYFYLDLFPREGKYGHAAEFPLLKGSKSNDILPVCALVCNFSMDTAEMKSVLQHKEVETYFHEFGHCMHEICSVSKFPRFHGTCVECDFVEAPSQMLENWCWDPSVLKKLSMHVETGESIPDSLIDRMLKAKNLNKGLFWLRQICIGMMDMKMHSKKLGENDLMELYQSMKEKISMFPAIPNTNWLAAFAHMTGGYSAGYYGYLWSYVYSCDMAKYFKEHGGFMSVECGVRYRREILEKGGTRDAIESLSSFLGREPNDTAFIEEVFGTKK